MVWDLQSFNFLPDILVKILSAIGIASLPLILIIPIPPIPVAVDIADIVSYN